MSTNKETPAMARITGLLDANSFVEIGSLVTARSTDFDLTAAKTPSDGVITGHGLIDGSLVFVYSQDATVLGGSIGEMHAKKIAALYDMAMKMQAPVIGFIDSSGMRLEESVDALDGFGQIYAKMAEANGVIPQICVVSGNCGGGLAVIPAMCDFAFMVEDKGRMYISSPDAIPGNTADKCDTAAAAFQAKENGCMDLAADEQTINETIQYLVSILPLNSQGDAHTNDELYDDLNRTCESMDVMKGDPRYLVSEMADNHAYFEAKAGYAPQMLTALIQLGGTTAGVVANCGVVVGDDGEVTQTDCRLDAHGCEKAADFVRFCDSFNIPILTLTNIEGYEASMCSEKHLAKALAHLAEALAQANVGKVNLITGKAYGTAGVLLNSKALGADLVYAWTDAQVSPMDADLAVKILYPDADAKQLSAKKSEYLSKQGSLAAAAARGQVDAVIAPEDTRKYLISAMEMLYTKSEYIWKKHSTK